MNAADMPHRVKRRDFTADPHKFIDIMIAPEFSQPIVFLGRHTALRLILCKKPDVVYRRKIPMLLFIGQQRAIVFQKEPGGAFSLRRKIRRKVFRIQRCLDGVAEKSQPAAFRRLRYPAKDRLESLLKSPCREVLSTCQIRQLFSPSRRGKQLDHILLFHLHVPQEFPAHDPVLRHFFQCMVHPVPPRFISDFIFIYHTIFSVFF